MTKLDRLIASLVAAAVVGFAPAAQAVPTLQLSDGTTTVTLADGDPGDLSALAGVVIFSGAIGNWVMNVTTGVGNPFLTGPHLDLNSVNASNIGSGSGFLDIKLSDINFDLGGLGATLAQFQGLIGGTTEGTVAWELRVDDGNTLFGMGTLIGSGMSAGAVFGEAFSSPTLVDGTFSMTLSVRITHGNSPNILLTSFDFGAQVVPEPGTLLLIGAALLGVVLIRRRI